MELTQPCLERGQAIGGRLDDDLMLLVLLDRSFPSVDGDHGRENVCARGKALVDESSRKAERIGLSTERREDDPDVGVGR